MKLGALTALAAVILIMLTCGCNPDASELNQKLIAQLIYISKGEQKYEIAALEQPSEEDSGERAYADGYSLSRAIEELCIKSGKDLLLSHTQIILLDEAMSDNQIAECLELLSKNNEIPLEVTVVFTKGCTAKQLAQDKAYENAAVLIQEAMKNSGERASSVTTTVSQLLSCRFGNISDGCVPLITLKNGEIAHEETAIFSGKSRTGKLNLAQTQCLLILQGKAENFYINTPDAEYYITDVKSNIQVTPLAGAVIARFNIKIYAQSIGAEYAIASQAEKLKNQLEKELLATAQKLVRECSSDPLSIRTSLFFKNPRYAFKHNIADADFLKTVDISCNVDVIIG